MSYVEILTAIHTGLSFVGLGLGIPAIVALFRPAVSKRWIAFFLGVAWATTLTGFIFPFVGFTPAFMTGIVSTIVLIAILLAHKVFHLSGLWRFVYAGGIVMSAYLLVFVAIAQAFLKIEFLNNLAPTLSEPPFGVTQLVAIVIFGYIGFKSVKKYHAV